MATVTVVASTATRVTLSGGADADNRTILSDIIDLDEADRMWFVDLGDGIYQLDRIIEFRGFWDLSRQTAIFSGEGTADAYPQFGSAGNVANILDGQVIDTVNGVPITRNSSQIVIDADGAPFNYNFVNTVDVTLTMSGTRMYFSSEDELTTAIRFNVLNINAASQLNNFSIIAGATPGAGVNFLSTMDFRNNPNTQDLVLDGFRVRRTPNVQVNMAPLSIRAFFDGVLPLLMGNQPDNLILNYNKFGAGITNVRAWANRVTIMRRPQLLFNSTFFGVVTNGGGNTSHRVAVEDNLTVVVTGNDTGAALEDAQVAFFNAAGVQDGETVATTATGEVTLTDFRYYLLRTPFGGDTGFSIVNDNSALTITSRHFSYQQGGGSFSFVASLNRLSPVIMNLDPSTTGTAAEAGAINITFSAADNEFTVPAGSVVTVQDVYNVVKLSHVNNINVANRNANPTFFNNTLLFDIYSIVVNGTVLPADPKDAISFDTELLDNSRIAAFTRSVTGMPLNITYGTIKFYFDGQVAGGTAYYLVEGANDVLFGDTLLNPDQIQLPANFGAANLYAVFRYNQNQRLRARWLTIDGGAGYFEIPENTDADNPSHEFIEIRPVFPRNNVIVMHNGVQVTTDGQALLYIMDNVSTTGMPAMQTSTFTFNTVTNTWTINNEPLLTGELLAVIIQQHFYNNLLEMPDNHVITYQDNVLSIPNYNLVLQGTTRFMNERDRIHCNVFTNTGGQAQAATIRTSTTTLFTISANVASFTVRRRDEDAGAGETITTTTGSVSFNVAATNVHRFAVYAEGIYLLYFEANPQTISSYAVVPEQIPRDDTGTTIAADNVNGRIAYSRDDANFLITFNYTEARSITALEAQELVEQINFNNAFVNSVLRGGSNNRARIVNNTLQLTGNITFNIAGGNNNAVTFEFAVDADNTWNPENNVANGVTALGVGMGGGMEAFTELTIAPIGIAGTIGLSYGVVTGTTYTSTTFTTSTTLTDLLADTEYEFVLTQDDFFPNYFQASLTNVQRIEVELKRRPVRLSTTVNIQADNAPVTFTVMNDNELRMFFNYTTAINITYDLFNGIVRRFENSEVGREFLLVNQLQGILRFYGNSIERVNLNYTIRVLVADDNTTAHTYDFDIVNAGIAFIQNNVNNIITRARVALTINIVGYSGEWEITFRQIGQTSFTHTNTTGTSVIVNIDPNIDYEFILTALAFEPVYFREQIDEDQSITTSFVPIGINLSDGDRDAGDGDVNNGLITFNYDRDGAPTVINIIASYGSDTIVNFGRFARIVEQLTHTQNGRVFMLLNGVRSILSLGVEEVQRLATTYTVNLSIAANITDELRVDFGVVNNALAFPLNNQNNRFQIVPSSFNITFLNYTGSFNFTYRPVGTTTFTSGSSSSPSANILLDDNINYEIIATFRGFYSEHFRANVSDCNILVIRPRARDIVLTADQISTATADVTANRITVAYDASMPTQINFTLSTTDVLIEAARFAALFDAITDTSTARELLLLNNISDFLRGDQGGALKFNDDYTLNMTPANNYNNDITLAFPVAGGTDVFTTTPNNLNRNIITRRSQIALVVEGTTDYGWSWVDLADFTATLTHGTANTILVPNNVGEISLVVTALGFEPYCLHFNPLTTARLVIIFQERESFTSTISNPTPISNFAIGGSIVTAPTPNAFGRFSLQFNPTVNEEFDAARFNDLIDVLEHSQFARSYMLNTEVGRIFNLGHDLIYLTNGSRLTFSIADDNAFLVQLAFITSATSTEWQTPDNNVSNAVSLNDLRYTLVVENDDITSIDVSYRSGDTNVHVGEVMRDDGTMEVSFSRLVEDEDGLDVYIFNADYEPAFIEINRLGSIYLNLVQFPRTQRTRITTLNTDGDLTFFYSGMEVHIILRAPMTGNLELTLLDMKEILQILRQQDSYRDLILETPELFEAFSFNDTSLVVDNAANLRFVYNTDTTEANRIYLLFPVVATTGDVATIFPANTDSNAVQYNMWRVQLDTTEDLTLRYAYRDATVMNSAVTHATGDSVNFLADYGVSLRIIVFSTRRVPSLVDILATPMDDVEVVLPNESGHDFTRGTIPLTVTTSFVGGVLQVLFNTVDSNDVFLTIAQFRAIMDSVKNTNDYLNLLLSNPDDLDIVTYTTDEARINVENAINFRVLSTSADVTFNFRLEADNNYNLSDPAGGFKSVILSQITVTLSAPVSEDDETLSDPFTVAIRAVGATGEPTIINSTTATTTARLSYGTEYEVIVARANTEPEYITFTPANSDSISFYPVPLTLIFVGADTTRVQGYIDDGQIRFDTNDANTQFQVIFNPSAEDFELNIRELHALFNIIYRNSEYLRIALHYNTGEIVHLEQNALSFRAMNAFAFLLDSTAADDITATIRATVQSQYIVNPIVDDKQVAVVAIDISAGIINAIGESENRVVGDIDEIRERVNSIWARTGALL